MKKFQLFVAFIFMATTVFCQDIPQTPEWLKESCEGGVFKVMPEGYYRVDRFMNAKGSNPKGMWMTLPNSYSALEAQQNLKLPVLSRATHKQQSIATSNAYLTLCMARPAAGVWIEDKKGEAQLLPFYILNNPGRTPKENLKHKEYNDLLKTNKVLHLRPHNNSGAVQIFYITTPENLANFRRDFPHLAQSSDDAIKKLIIDRNIITKGPPVLVDQPKAANDNNRTPPSPANDNNGRSPNPPLPPSPTFKLKDNIETRHMNDIKNTYNKLPGGVLVDSRTLLPTSIYKIAWDNEKMAFIFNDTYAYETHLREDEIAEICRLAQSRDPRMGAISQDEFINLNPNSTVAEALSSADIVLGKILYGSDMQGNKTPNGLVKGYENPEEKDNKTLRWCLFNWGKTSKIAEKEISSLQQRVFIEFKGFDFELKSNWMASTNADIQVSYQTFTTDYFTGKQVFSEKTPDKVMPEFAKAVTFFRNNYAAFENQYPELAKARAIAEVFSICKAIREKGLVIENQEFAVMPVLEIPTTYEFYNNYEADSEQSKEAATILNRLSWFPAWMLGKDGKFKMYYLRLDYACKAHDYEKIAEYRVKLLELLDKMDKFSVFFEQKPKLIAMVKATHATGIFAKVNFGRKYLAENRYTAEANLFGALKYFERMAKIEPNNAINFQGLNTIYELLKEEEKAKNAFQQYVTLLEKEAKTDIDAMNSLALLLYYGNSKYSVTVDKERATELFNKAINKNHAVACYNLAYISYFDKEHNDLFKSKELFEKSLQLGYVEAANMLGIAAYNNKDYSTALNYLKQSAQEGSAESKYVLGRMYLNGEGVEANKDTTYLYWKQSAELGYSRAKSELQDLEIAYSMSVISEKQRF